MVCPYRLVTTGITAVLSILWIRRATAMPSAEEAHVQSLKSKQGADAGACEDACKRKWTPGTVLLVIALVLLHVDLMFTGYLRAGVKDMIAQIRHGR